MAHLSSYDVTAVAVVLFGTLACLVKAIQGRAARPREAKDNPFDEHFFARGEMTPRQLRLSMAATYSAFATVFFWFIALGGSYGWLLFFIPLCLFLGNALFVFMVSKLDITVGFRRTIAQFVRDNAELRPLHYAVDWVVAVFLFSAVLVEIVIGSGILASMVPDVPNAQVFLFTAISVLVVSYVVIGGQRTVILTDVWQVVVTFVGVGVLFLFVVFWVRPAQGAESFLSPPRLLSRRYWRLR